MSLVPAELTVEPVQPEMLQALLEKLVMTYQSEGPEVLPVLFLGYHAWG